MNEIVVSIIGSLCIVAAYFLGIRVGKVEARAAQQPNDQPVGEAAKEKK